MAKVVLITGASAGIGKGLAIEFADRGYDLVLAARRIEKLEELEKQIRSAHKKTRILCVQCDVTKELENRALIARVAEEMGQLDVVVANAGFGVGGAFEKLELEDYRRQFETNVFGAMSTVKESLPLLKKSKGSVAVIGSVMSFVSVPNHSAYSMSKYAIRAFAEALYHELKPEGVSVTFIGPGYVVSEISQVDNLGNYRKDWKARGPGLFMVETHIAARHMASAIIKREQEAIITKHGKAAVFLRNHFPSLTKSLMGQFSKR